MPMIPKISGYSWNHLEAQGSLNWDSALHVHHLSLVGYLSSGWSHTTCTCLWCLISQPFCRVSQALLPIQNGSCDIPWSTEIMYKTRHKCQEFTTGHAKALLPLLWHTRMFLHGSVIMRAPELAQGTLVRRALWTGYEPGLGLALRWLLLRGIDTSTNLSCAQ